ncbi:MAG: hypothetical protein ABIH82_01405 [Candidatus Woesearchaeota archaeon]
MLQVLRKSKQLRGEHGSITIKKVLDRGYNELQQLRLGRFEPEQRGWFGIDDKVLIVNRWKADNELLSYPSSTEVYELARKLTREWGLYDESDRHEVTFQSLVNGKSSVEITRGIFKTPREEQRLDEVLKEMVDEVSARMGLMPFYAGQDPAIEAKSYGHHVHFSAGSPLDTMLLYLEMRNDLWRATSFSANSPLFNFDDEESGDEPVLMCSRLGRTHVVKLCPPTYKVTDKSLKVMEPDEISAKAYPLLIDNRTGTVEVRASDIDVCSSATVAYIVLLLHTRQRQIEQARVVNIYDNNTIQWNMDQAKRYGLSDRGSVDVIVDGEAVDLPIQEEMKRHWEDEMLPTLQSLGGMEFIPEHVLEVIEERIYSGAIPAQRVVDEYSNTLARGHDRITALAAAQEPNLFRAGNYFRDEIRD